MTEVQTETVAPVESEFGSGFIYPLALFVGHAMDGLHNPLRANDPSLWFYGASDHLGEFMPERAPTPELQERAQRLRDRCMHWRLPMDRTSDPTPEDKAWAIEEAKEILRLTDIAHGVPAVKASWD